jgi:hypothetical protein
VRSLMGRVSPVGDNGLGAGSSLHRRRSSRAFPAEHID